MDPVGCYNFIKEQDYLMKELDAKIDKIDSSSANTNTNSHKAISGEKGDTGVSRDEIGAMADVAEETGELDEDENEMNELMDLFDDYIYRGNRVLSDALSKMDSMISA